jgi:hypothetical protein
LALGNIHLVVDAVSSKGRVKTVGLYLAEGDDEEAPRGAARVGAFLKRMLARF